MGPFIVNHHRTLDDVAEDINFTSICFRASVHGKGRKRTLHVVRENRPRDTPLFVSTAGAPVAHSTAWLSAYKCKNPGTFTALPYLTPGQVTHLRRYGYALNTDNVGVAIHDEGVAARFLYYYHALKFQRINNSLTWDRLKR